MTNRRSRAEELGLELMEPEPARLPNAGARTQQLGDILADLGYNRLQDAVAKPVPLEALKSGNLLEALRMANITPFTWESVDRYKSNMLSKLNPRPDITNAHRAERKFWLSFSAGAVLFVVTGNLFSSHAFWAYWLATGAAGIGFFVLSSVFGERYQKLLNEYYDAVFGPKYVWETVALKDFPKDIPIEAAERIAAVRAIYPKAKFEIDYLAKHPDPFLVAHHRKERYAIAVWDEPTFEAELLA